MNRKNISICALFIGGLLLFIFFLENKQSADIINSSSLLESKLGIIQKADDIMNNKYTFTVSENDEEFVFQFTESVFEIDNEIRSIQRKVYNFEFLEYLRIAYKLTDEEKYIKKGMEFVQFFTEEAPFNSDHMTWHDETTAVRLNNYYEFYKDGYEILTYSDKHLLEEEMQFIAKKIAYTKFYSGNNNHGMYQDYAMLKYAIEFNDVEMVDIGSKRLEEYFLSHFDKAGVHLVNSPEYHFHMVESLKNLLDLYDEEVLSTYHSLEEIYQKSVNFANMVVLPNGIIPNIGDSKDMEIELERYYSPEIIKQSRSSGRATFYESGYDILKEEDTYLLFRAGYLQDYHHHNDDLSFWLYKDGNIFTEVGSYGYEYTVPYTDYAKTFKAHNTLIVNGENETETRDVYLLDSKDPNIMSGETHRIVGTYFKRDIYFNDELTEFTITDFIESESGESKDYELLFHLDPNISIEVISDGNENTVELIRDDKKIGEFLTKYPISITEDVYFPFYYAEPQETKVIVVEVSGDQVVVETNIILE